MTQSEETVGGTNDTVVAAEPTIEDRFAAAIGEEQEEEAPEDGEGEIPELEIPEEGEPEDEAEVDEVDLAPIDPPVSLTAEEKEAFKEWPRDAQEAFSRRVGDLEKGLHAKAQEARTNQQQTEQRATENIRQMQDFHVQTLQAMLPEVPPEPSAHLQISDPLAYANQLEDRKWALAQHGHVQQVINQIGQYQQQTDQAAKAELDQSNRAVLQDKLPDLLDKEKGPELAKAIQSTGRHLGYSDDQLALADARDLIALHEASHWKVKADKYDTLMSNQMQRAREAKNLPRVSRPGSPQGKGAAENQRYAKDRDAMRSGDRDATARVFGRFLT